MTDPVMELLEQHKSALETKLGQVKNDVTAVLDQVEQEQLDKGKLNEQLMQQDIKNRSQAAELTEAQDEVEQLRMKLQSLEGELSQMNEAMQIDEEQYREQIEEANRMNSELQQQVE